MTPLALVAVAAVAISFAQSFPTAEAFKTATAAQKISALQAIASGRMTMPANILDPYVTMAIADSDARVREQGLAALSWFEARRAIRPEAAKRPTTELQHHERSLRRLLSDDPDARVRMLALSALSYLTMRTPMRLTDDMTRVVIDRVQVEPDGFARMNALGLLSSTPGPEVTAVLLKTTGDRVASVRAKAIEVIGLQRVVAAIPRLAEMLTKDADWFPRWHAARAIGRLAPDSRSVIGAVEARAKVEFDARVREEITKTLALLRRE